MNFSRLPSSRTPRFTSIGECFMALRSARDYRHRRFAARVLDARGRYFGNVSRGNAELACLFFIVNAKGETPIVSNTVFSVPTRRLARSSRRYSKAAL